jgi:CHAD domain-containing protein
MAAPKPDLLWDESKPAAECARQALPKLAADFFSHGREVVTSTPSIEDLHKLRLTVKRFRYAIELFRPCYGSGLEQRLDALKRMQDHLGAMNDCEASTALVLQGLPEATGSQEFLQFLRTHGEEQRGNFLRHWQDTFDAPGQQEWWVEYLARPETIGSGRAREQSESESDHTLKKTASG